MATVSNFEKIEEVRKELDLLNAKTGSADRLMDGITRLLHDKMLKYNWVGFYMLEPGTKPPILVLGHFQGAMTPHTRIPLNEGICGAAASSGKTVVDFSIFRTQRIDGLIVRTGWKYQKVDDPAPSSKWCYLEKASVSDGLQLPIATDGHVDHFNPDRAVKTGITWNDVQRALPYCDWFKGANPNIREKSGERL